MTCDTYDMCIFALAHDVPSLAVLLNTCSWVVTLSFYRYRASGTDVNWLTQESSPTAGQEPNLTLLSSDCTKWKLTKLPLQVGRGLKRWSQLLGALKLRTAFGSPGRSQH